MLKKMWLAWKRLATCCQPWYTVQPIWKRLRLFSHICLCKPAQSLQSSRGDVWRVWIPSRENGTTCCDGTIKFLTRAQCFQDRSFFGFWWPSEPRFFHCSNMENELKSCQNSEFCMDAGFLNVVQIGQYVRTKNTAELSHFHAFWQNWRRANGIRVEYFPRIEYVAAQWSSQTFTVESKCETSKNSFKKNHLHVDVQRHLMGTKRQQDRMRVKCWTRFSTCKKIWSRTMVISRFWIREQVVLN